jgi:hypothetical protein
MEHGSQDQADPLGGLGLYSRHDPCADDRPDDGRAHAGRLAHALPDGIVFVLAHAHFFPHVVKGIGSAVLRGAVFGMAVFAFAQVVMANMGAMLCGMPTMEGRQAMLVKGMFGIAMALVVKIRPSTIDQMNTLQ